ncbi:hypothetical protein ACF1A5_12335 [Streptomyces sp. NPDC014864]|uniref:hypothetical protein n=1 Tax=Streptomyces sp. NPDC014864 TaxID=3364924 RepID=UPI0036F9FF72
MTIHGEQPLIRVVHDESRSDLRDPARPRPVRLYLWEPDLPLALPAPLVVVSHGTGGSGSSMGWPAGPLRQAGFRVVALDHHGNNFVDGYEPEGFLHVWERPRDVSFALDALASERPPALSVRRGSPWAAARRWPSPVLVSIRGSSGR